MSKTECPGCGSCYDPECCGVCDCADRWEEIVGNLQVQLKEVRETARTALEDAAQRVREVEARARRAETRLAKMADAWRFLSSGAEKPKPKMNREL